MTPLCELLSNREEAVALAWAEDLSLSDVARRVGITPRQARRATETGMRKCGVSSRTAFVAVVVRLRGGVVAG